MNWLRFNSYRTTMGHYLQLLLAICIISAMGSSNASGQPQGNHSLSLENWARQQGRFWDEQHWLIGDFDGDGAEDLARVFRDGRDKVSIDVYHSSKESFESENWARQQGRYWDDQHWLAGDFDGDGADDLARVFRDGRDKVSIDVYHSSRESFESEYWVRQQGRYWDEQHWLAGDFNDDGADDLARMFRDGRDKVSIDVYLSTQ